MEASVSVDSQEVFNKCGDFYRRVTDIELTNQFLSATWKKGIESYKFASASNRKAACDSLEWISGGRKNNSVDPHSDEPRSSSSRCTGQRYAVHQCRRNVVEGGCAVLGKQRQNG